MKTAVGDKYVLWEYDYLWQCDWPENRAVILFFSKHATTGDGILTSLKVMETMIENKQTLAQLTEGVKIYPQLFN